MNLILDSPTELLALRSRSARRDVSRIVLAFKRDDVDERAINRGLRACGCDTGAIFLFIAIASMLIAFEFGWRASWWIVGAIVFGAALVGKIAGIVFAEWRLRATIDRLT